MQPSEIQQLAHNKCAQDSIRVMARKLSRKAIFGRGSREDIQQDLWLVLLHKAGHFKAERGCLNTFIDRVVKSAAATLIRDRKRTFHADGFAIQSLDRPGDKSSFDPLRSLLNADDGSRRRATSAHDELEDFKMKEAIALALSRMPSDLREFCQLILDGDSLVEAARQLGLSRRPARQLLTRIRRFIQVALGEQF